MSDAPAPAPTPAPAALPAPAPASTEVKAKRVAVMKTETSGDVDAALGPQVTSKLAEEIRAQTKAEVISSDEIVALLKHEKEKAILGECKEQESCLAEIANALGAEVVVSAKLTMVATKAPSANAGDVHPVYALAVSAVDAGSAAVVGRVNESWGGDALGLLSLARPVVTKLFATTSIPKGSVEIVGSIGGSKIVVDGEVRGSSELATISDLLVGAHHIEVQHPEKKPIDKWIVVEANKTASLPVTQESFDEPVLGTWWFWTAAVGGVAVAGASVAGVVLALANSGKTGVDVQLNADKTLATGGAR
jgi:hypothetical protein